MVIQFWILAIAVCALDLCNRQMQREVGLVINAIDKCKGLNLVWVLVGVEIALKELLRQLVLYGNLAIRYFNQKYQL